MNRPTTLALVIALGATASAVAAKPNLEGAKPIGALVVYPDDQQAGLFYYGPGQLAVAQDPTGKPDLHFLQTRYTGSVSRADRGTVLERGRLSFRVEMRPASADDLREARRAVANGTASVELRPLPIQRLEAAVVYAPIGATAETSLPGGHFDGTGGEPGETTAAFWTSRSFALGLDPQTSQLFWGSLL